MAQTGTKKPMVADLSADEIARAILRAWGRQPWEEGHWMALVDRMMELDRAAPEVEAARGLKWYLRYHRRMRSGRPRRYVLRRIRRWTQYLAFCFGEHMRITTCE